MPHTSDINIADSLNLVGVPNNTLDKSITKETILIFMSEGKGAEGVDVVWSCDKFLLLPTSSTEFAPLAAPLPSLYSGFKTDFKYACVCSQCG